MTIYDFDKIDIIATTDSGLKLVIADPANLFDEDRLYAMKNKVDLYRTALSDAGFRSENEGWENTQIEIKAASPPTEPMKELTSITFEVEGESYDVPISFEIVESPFSTPDSEKMHLIDVNYNYRTLSDKVINLATEFIQSGSFTPFGMSWDLDGETAIKDASFSPPEEGIELVREALQESVSEDEAIQAVALAFDAIAIHPDQTEKSDAIAINLEHRLGSPMTMMVHYKLIEGKVETIEPYGVPKDLEYFTGGPSVGAGDPSSEDLIGNSVDDPDGGMSEEEKQS